MVILGIFLSTVFGLLLVIDTESTNSGTAKWHYVIPTITGIILIAIPQIQNIRKSHTIRYNKTGLTAKLLGFKTFGFQYDNVKSIHLNEELLQIEVIGMETISLSRKRYNHNSLLQLKQIIEQHKTQL